MSSIRPVTIIFRACQTQGALSKRLARRFSKSRLCTTSVRSELSKLGYSNCSSIQNRLNISFVQNIWTVRIQATCEIIIQSITSHRDRNRSQDLNQLGMVGTFSTRLWLPVTSSWSAVPNNRRKCCSELCEIDYFNICILACDYLFLSSKLFKKIPGQSPGSSKLD